MKRFWSDVSVAPCDGGFAVQLDRRAVKTQGGAAQIVPTAALAEALAAEWRAQGEDIDAALFVHRDLADYAIDIVRADRAAAIATLLGFAQTDTLCYRADPGSALALRQDEMWEPLLAALESRLGIVFVRVAGVLPQPQHDATLLTLESHLATLDDFTLAALQTLASLAASLTVGLAALEARADSEALFDAANLEEDWQAELWGADTEAKTVRGLRAESFTQAAEFAALLD